MASTAAQLAALGRDSQFQYRVSALIIQQAAVVYAQAPGPAPDTRRLFAKSILTNPDQALRLAAVVANRPNLIAGTTSYDFASWHVVTDVTDAAIASQINTDWDMLASV